MSKLCTVEGCAAKSKARGYCNKHYQRWRSHGDPTHTRIAVPAAKGEPLRFLTHAVQCHSADCIEWPFAKDSHGYGQIHTKRGMKPAHREALLMSKGGPPDPRSLATHKPVICHNRACINPYHLEWGSPVKNSADRVMDQTCPRGSRSPRAKLSEREVLSIKADSRPRKEIAKDYGVSETHVYRIKRGVTWVHAS